MAVFNFNNCDFFFLGQEKNFLTLLASLLGSSAILLNAKGNPLGQAMMIIFCLFYGYISFTFKYYGELATYAGMTMPMSVFALISWLKNPFKGKKNQVKVNQLSKKEVLFMFLLSIPVTILFYFILRAFNTKNLLPSTLSVTTSFIAVYLTFRRSPYFSLAYICNDLILILLWILAALENFKYFSVSACFFAFLLNDLYAFINWKKMERWQKE
ncbi:MAG: nicotinamide riboside transporter PnuC [Treponema sp.]|nr:nicotinamide riboside transporter PnuC [Treponema sp.]